MERCAALDMACELGCMYSVADLEERFQASRHQKIEKIMRASNFMGEIEIWSDLLKTKKSNVGSQQQLHFMKIERA